MGGPVANSGVADVLKYSQQNAHLDEMALQLTPTFTNTAGSGYVLNSMSTPANYTSETKSFSASSLRG
jgi:hypothetical protein